MFSFSEEVLEDFGLRKRHNRTGDHSARSGFILPVPKLFIGKIVELHGTL
jgi:hypothetical protein